MDKVIKKIVDKIAKEHLFIETLEVQGRDHLDFHDVSVVGVKRALEAAYKAGYDAGYKAADPLS